MGHFYLFENDKYSFFRGFLSANALFRRRIHLSETKPLWPLHTEHRAQGRHLSTLACFQMHLSFIFAQFFERASMFSVFLLFLSHRSEFPWPYSLSDDWLHSILHAGVRSLLCSWVHSWHERRHPPPVYSGGQMDHFHVDIAVPAPMFSIFSAWGGSRSATGL